MKKDDILLNEAYKKVIEQQLDEDLGSFFKTVGGDVVRGIGGAAKKAVIGAQKGFSKAKQMGIGAVAGAKGQDPRSLQTYKDQQIKQGKLSKKRNAVDSQYTGQRLTQYLNSMLTGVARDVKNLGLGIQDTDALKQDLFNTFKKHLQQSGTIQAAGTGLVRSGSKGVVKLNK
jgi:hypothetical protein